MSDFLDYIIIGLFLIFCIYFLYTLVDTLYLSKRKRSVRKRPLKEEKKEDNVPEPETSDGQDDEGKSISDNQPTKDDEMKSDNKDSSRKTEKRVSSLGSIFSSFRRKSRSQVPKRPEKVKIDDDYFDALKKFFIATNGSWTKERFYDFFSDISRKGYDKRPSELTEDLEIIRKQLDEERKMRTEANLSDKDSDEPKEDDDTADTDSADESSEKKESSAKEESSGEKESSPTDYELKEAEKDLEKKMKSEKKDTRDELDKTLKEIREIRQRLSKFE